MNDFEEVKRRLDLISRNHKVKAAIRELRLGLKNLSEYVQEKADTHSGRPKEARANQVKTKEHIRKNLKLTCQNRVGPKNGKPVKCKKVLALMPSAPKKVKEFDRVDCSHCLQPNIGIHAYHWECPDCNVAKGSDKDGEIRQK